MDETSLASRTVRGVGVAVFVVAAFLLTSMGGAGMVASPVTLPLMYGLVRARPTQSFVAAGIIIGGMTALQGGWGLGYLTLAHHEGLAFVTGSFAAAVAVAVFAAVGRRAARDGAWTTT